MIQLGVNDALLRSEEKRIYSPNCTSDCWPVIFFQKRLGIINCDVNYAPVKVKCFQKIVASLESASVRQLR